MTIVFELFAALLTLAGLVDDERPEPTSQIVVDATATSSVVDTAGPVPTAGSATSPPEETPAVDPPEAEESPLGQASGEVDQSVYVPAPDTPSAVVVDLDDDGVWVRPDRLATSEPDLDGDGAASPGREEYESQATLVIGDVDGELVEVGP
ncbi:MAG: hypothetical protein AAGA99_27250 [Actinomycetota bacterium]